MAFDYRKLRGKIKEVCGTQEKFAKAINLSNNSISLKLNNQREWTQKEIKKSLEALNISDNEIATYFFYPKSIEN